MLSRLEGINVSSESAEVKAMGSVAADACASMCEATIVSALVSTKFSSTEKKSFFDSAMPTIEKQTETLRCDVKCRVHQPLLDLWWRWMLNN